MGQSVSRKKNSVRNTFYAALSMIVQFLLKYVGRMIFIRYLNIEFLGLNTLYANIFAVLSLAELGVGSAIVYSMYKPIADNDTEKVKSLVAVYKKFYWIVGTFIMVVGLALIPALPYLMNGGTSLDINLNAVYVIFLLNSGLGYFFAHRRAVIFANQRNDIETKVSLVTSVLLNVSQIVLLVATKNYFVYIVTLPVFTVLESIVIVIVSYRMFPELRGKAAKLDKDSGRGLMKNTFAMLGHKIGGVAVNGTDNIFISSFLGLTILGVFSNYSLILTSVTSIVGVFLTATRASIGNMVNTETLERNKELFDNLSFLLFWIVGFCFIGIFTLSQDFVRLSFGEDLRVSLPVLLVLSANFYIMQSRGIILSYKECTGLFWNDRFKPILETVVNLSLDWLLVYYMGLAGIFLATIISNVVCNLTVEPYIIYKHFFKQKVWRYYVKYIVYAGITALVAAATFFLCTLIPEGGIGLFIAKALVCAVFSNLLYLLVFFRTKEFRYFWTIIKGIFHRRKPIAETADQGATDEGEVSVENPSETNAGDAGEEGDRNKPEL